MGAMHELTPSLPHEPTEGRHGAGWPTAANATRGARAPAGGVADEKHVREEALVDVAADKTPILAAAEPRLRLAAAGRRGKRPAGGIEEGAFAEGLLYRARQVPAQRG
jgi:hypothetical protein